nr:META domain-containing protein [Streptomyces graminilatus]
MKKQRLTSVSLSILALTVIPLAAACGSEKASSSSQTVGAGTGTGKGSGTSDGTRVTGVHWAIDDLTVDGKKSPAPAGAFLRIDKNGKVSGNYGCNTFGSTAKIDGNSIDLGRTQSTDMGCLGDRMTFEKNLSKALADGALIAKAQPGVKGENGLTLTTRSGDIIHLSEAKDRALYDTKWTVTALGFTQEESEGDTDSGSAVGAPLPSGAQAYLVFDKEKGTVSGKAGCNNVSAEATVSDGTITFGSPSTTRRMCDGSLMETEKAFLKIFDSKVKYEINQGSLSLTSANGTTADATATD